jgi:hypothetical protein
MIDARNALLREWLETEMDSQDEGFMEWIESFEKRVTDCLAMRPLEPSGQTKAVPQENKATRSPEMTTGQMATDSMSRSLPNNPAGTAPSGGMPVPPRNLDKLINVEVKRYVKALRRHAEQLARERDEHKRERENNWKLVAELSADIQQAEYKGGVNDDPRAAAEQAGEEIAALKVERDMLYESAGLIEKRAQAAEERAERNERDAKRYQYLRQYDPQDRQLFIGYRSGNGISAFSVDVADQAIDAAIGRVEPT